ncbi:MAG: hypothetical protein VX341_13960 [Bdellovibrionota bacterium]|nr:hypothetical protein [Bdellovibrionota bacterium]
MKRNKVNFIKIILFLIIINLKASCGKAQLFDEGTYDAKEQFLITDEKKCPECEALQEQFIEDFNLNDDPIKIGLDDLEDNRVGACYIYTSGEPAYIKISRSHWKNLSINTKKALIYHELGHCLLGLGHIDSFELIEDPKYHTLLIIKLSIMNPTMMNAFQSSFVDYKWTNYKIALDNALSITDTYIDDFSNLRDNYYEDIRTNQEKVTFEDNSLIINEEMIYDVVCIDGELIYKNKDVLIRLEENGEEYSCEREFNTTESL